MDTNTVTPIHRLTVELVDIGGPLASLVSHMQESAAARGEQLPSPNTMLIDLIEPTIADLAEGWSDDRIRDAADIIHAACQRVCSEVFIVPDSRAQRRARRPRAPRRRPRAS
jgi:hypothetical protein